MHRHSITAAPIRLFLIAVPVGFENLRTMPTICRGDRCIYEFFGSSTQRDNHVRVNNPRPTRITKFVGYEFVKFR